MTAQDETQGAGSKPQADGPYVEDRDPVIYALCLAAASIEIWMLGDWKLDSAADYGRFFGRLIGALTISFLVGFIIAKITLRLIGQKPWAARTGFGLGACLIVALLGFMEHRHSDSQAVRAGANPAAPAQQIPGKAEMERLLTNEGRIYVVETQQRSLKYQADCAAIAGNGLINSAQLGTPENISVLRAKLTQLRKLTDNMGADYQSAGDAILHRVQALPIDDQSKHSFVIAFNESHKAAEATTNESLALARQSFDECEKLADFVSARFGEFKVADNTLLFKSERDVAEFRRILVRLNEITKRQQELAGKTGKMMREAEQGLK